MSNLLDARRALASILICAAGLAAPHVSFAREVFVGFESGTLDGVKRVRENLPTVARDPVRSGKYVMKSVLRADARTAWGRERTEVSVRGTEKPPMNQSMWYGFSIFLPSDYKADKIWELVMQWYPTPDASAESGRQPTLALHTTNGVWSLTSRSSSSQVTPIWDKSIKQRTWSVGTTPLNKWTDWVINVRWSHQSSGFLKVWKDGKVVVDYKGPTSYNDKRGPFAKMGIYKGWVSQGIDKVRTRTVYHDDFRMMILGGSYSAVAPGKR